MASATSAGCWGGPRGGGNRWDKIALLQSCQTGRVVRGPAGRAGWPRWDCTPDHLGDAHEDGRPSLADDRAQSGRRNLLGQAVADRYNVTSRLCPRRLPSRPVWAQFWAQSVVYS